MPFAVRVQHLLPQRALCAFIYAVSRSRIRWFKAALIRWFAKQYRVDLNEAREADLSAYSSFNAFFTRALRDGAREIDPRREAIVSPADGRLTQFAEITGDRIVQAKGFDYSLSELLGETSDIDGLIGGLTATIYLAPHNYHRVHAPFAGRLVSMQYIAGRRFSVNASTASWIDRLYCRNERLVCWFESDLGRYAAVLVGALNVSSISTSATGEIASGRDFEWRSSQPPIVERGEEFACFNLGSTVILALPPGARFIDLLNAGQSVRVGECIALTGQGN
jgi:phosphatidylserine decarboxylase